MNGADKSKSLRQILGGPSFPYGVELLTTRGFEPPEQASKVVKLGEALCGDPRISWISITDNPGGHTMLPPDWLANLLTRQKTQIVLHFSCKDRNRSSLEAAAWKYAADGFDNLLVMTGDYPKTAYGGSAGPVFDLDSVSLIQMLTAMNSGLTVPGRRGEMTVLPKTNFSIGCVISPFKRHERELMPQYFKLLRKIACGAQYIYTQLGYDMRKFYEVKLLLKAHGLSVPVIGNVYLLNKTSAGIIHRGDVPGCVISDPLYELIGKYAAGPDKGRSFFIELAAKQLAVFKGLDFAGGYLSGASKAESFFEVIERAEKFGPNDWREFAKEIQFAQPGEFYLFEQDPETGLGDVNRVNRDYLRSLDQPAKSRQITLGYRMSRFFHDRFFTPNTRGFNCMKRLYSRWEKKPTLLARTTRGVEQLSKYVWFGCRDCGDCSLPETGYLCPLATCAKDQRNGPCGGTHDAICEVFDRECIWSRAYDRMKFFRETEQMIKGPAVYYNAELKGTSSWANQFLGRDHYANSPSPAPKRKE